MREWLRHLPRTRIQIIRWRLPLWVLGLAAVGVVGIVAVAGQAVGPIVAGQIAGSTGVTVSQSIVVTQAEFRDYPPTLLYSISPRDDKLRVIDTSDVIQTTSSVTIFLPGKVVEGGNGLALHPVTNVLYALLKLQNQAGRQLVTLNPTTGEATTVGNTGDKFAGLAFHSNGVLYAVTGEAAGVPETLYTLSLVNAAPTFVKDLDHGNEGETIAFNPDDGLLYHASGLGIPNVNEIFETIDPTTLAVTQITLLGQDYSEATALTYEGDRNFFLADLGRRLYRINTDGVVRFEGVIDHDTHGLVPFDLAVVPDAVAAINDEGTSFTAALVTHVGRSLMLILTLENLSDADANATLELKVPQGIDVDAKFTGSINGAQLSKTVWLMKVPSSLTEGKVRIILKSRDDHQPGFYTMSARIVQITG